MPSRHDLVLAVIPVLVAVGVTVELAARTLGATLFGTHLAALPFRTGGFLAALGVIGREITSPVGRE